VSRAALKRIAVALIALAAVAACARLLGLGKGSRKPFEHRAHVLAGVPCTTCHQGMSSAGDDSPLHLPDDASCVAAGCHPSPHDRGSCLGCHGEAWTAFDVAQAREHLRFSHDRHEEPLLGNCARCHVGVAEGGSRLRPSMATCLSCHQHDDQFADRTCDACHVDLEAERAVPVSHLVHDAGWDRSHGGAASASPELCSTCHAEKFCGGCHGASVPALPSVRYFDDVTRASVHRAGFASRHSVEARIDPGTCTTCHSQESCVGCHTERHVAAGPELGLTASPHPPGWVGAAGPNEHGRAARRDPAACASCHGGGGEALCVSCHKVGGVGGSVHPPGWSSTLDRGRDTPCRMCHLP
jgi:hypothetical protein